MMKRQILPIERIRREILGISQVAMAAVTSTSQATVSRWENGELEPDRSQMEAIRRAVRKRRLDWDDRWFFEAPERAS